MASIASQQSSELVVNPLLKSSVSGGSGIAEQFEPLLLLLVYMVRLCQSKNRLSLYGYALLKGRAPQILL